MLTAILIEKSWILIMKKTLFLLPILLSFLLYAQENEDNGSLVKFPGDYQGQLNVVYTHVHGWDGKLDFYNPKNSKTPTPLIIDIHGGGWQHGVKESHRDFGPFFNMHWAVANVEYRVAHQAFAPAAIQDVRCALIYLIQHARELNIDPDKIVVMGNSSGGHLALMTGLLGGSHIFDQNCPGVDSIKVFAIIDKYGQTDLRYPHKLLTKSLLKWAQEKVSDSKFLESISPITYVNEKSPPVFILHGDDDNTVSYSQSVALNDLLEESGVVHQFMTIKGGSHGDFTTEENDHINKNIINFLTKLGIDK